MRVMQVMGGTEHGGAEAHFVKMVCALQKAGIEQKAILKQHPVRAEQLRKAGVDVVEVIQEDFTSPSVTDLLRKEAQQFKPAIVQTWMYQATRAMPRGDYLQMGWLRGYQHLSDYRNCDHLIGMTKGVVTSIMEQGWQAERIHHIRPFAEEKNSPPMPRSQFDTPENAPLLLAMGRLHWHKAFDTLIMALPQLENHYVWIAGEGELRRELEDFAREIGVRDRVRFLGWQDDQAALFGACDMVVVPSRYEPFGLVMIEAWAHHKPLVATKAVGPRATAQDEVDALMVPIDDVDALVRAITRMHNDHALRETLVRHGYAHFQRDYTIQSAVAQYTQLYQEVLQIGSLANRNFSPINQLTDRVRRFLNM